MKNYLLTLSLLSVFVSVQAQVTVYWRDSNDGTTGANWVGGFGFGGGETPAAGDIATISGSDVDDTTVIYVDSLVPSPANMEIRDRGATLQIRSGGSLAVSGITARTDFNQGNFTLSVQGGSMTVDSAAYGPSTSGGNDTSRLYLSVSSGNLTFNPGGDNNNGLIQNGSNVSISGGTVDMGDARIQIDNTAAFNWTGGTLRKVNRFMGDNVNAQTLTNGGGTFFVNTNTRTDDLMSYNNGTGTTVFAINADGSTDAELSQFSGGGVWDLTTGIVAVDFGTYTPLVGDSWDFTALAAGASTFLASTANVSSTSADGLWSITWNTSSWVSDGILTVEAVTPNGSAIAPEGVAIAIVGSDVEVTFDSINGQSYQLLISTDNMASFAPVAGASDTGDGNPLTLVDAGGAPATGEKVFYKVDAN